jgi:hypothetical protein
MIVVSRPKIAFIHVPKAGGTSIAHLLCCYSNPFCARLLQSIAKSLKIPGHSHLPISLYYKYFAAYPSLGPHATALDMLRVLGSDLFQAYFKFAVVRDPFDWILSHYYYIRRTPAHMLHDRVLRLYGLLEFVSLVSEYDLIYSQSHYLMDASGNLLVNKLLRFECLQEDFGEAFWGEGEMRLLGKVPINLPRLNYSSRPSEYWSDYSTIAQSEVLRLKFKADFQIHARCSAAKGN